MMQGADNAGLEAKIKQHYTESSQDEDSGVKGFVRHLVKDVPYSLVWHLLVCNCNVTLSLIDLPLFRFFYLQTLADLSIKMLYELVPKFTKSKVSD